MSNQIEVGSYVSIPNPLAAFMPGAKPRDYGVVVRIDEDTYFVVFPIGQDNPLEHSQCAPYDEHELRLESAEDAIANLPLVWAGVDPMKLAEAA